MLKQLPRTDRLVLTNANQEYPYTFVQAFVALDVQCQQARDVLMSFEVNGTDAPANGTPFTLKSGTVFYKDVRISHFPFTIYFRDTANAGSIIEFIIWEEKG